MADREVKVKLIVTGAEEGAAKFERLAVAAGASGETIGRNLQQGIENGLSQAEGASRQAGNRIGDHVGDGIVQGTREGADDAAGEAGDAGETIGAGMADAIKGAITGAAIGAALVAAMDVETGNAKLQSQLGITADEAGEAGTLAGELWTGNYADSMEEARDLTRSTISALGDFSSDFAGDEIKKYAGYASNLSAMTGEEADSIIQAVSRMMRTGLVGNVDEAFDVLTRASQKTTAGMQGDLIDVGSEYADVFAQVGFDGSQAFSALANASKDGAINMDKVGDSLKEFTILATNLDDTGEIYQQLGLDGQKMANDLLAGGETARAAMMTIVQALQSIEDPTTQATTAISFFGAPLEDLGTRNIPAFLGSLAAANEGLGDFTGSASEADATLGDTMAGRFSTLTKEAMGVGTAFGQTLLPALEALMPVFTVAGEILGDIGALLGALPGWALPAAAGITAIGMALNTARGHAGGFKAGLADMGKSLAKGGALALGVAIFAAIGDKIADNNRKAEEFNAMVESLAGTIVEAGGAWDELAEKQLRAEIEGSNGFRELRAAGLSYTEVMQVIAMDAGAAEKATDALASKYGDVELATVAVQGFANSFNNVKNEAIALAGEKIDFNSQKESAAAAKEQSDRYVGSLLSQKAAADAGYDSAWDMAMATAEAGKSANDAGPKFQTLADATGFYTSETDSATSATALFEAALESLVDGTVSIDTATRAAAAANREMEASVREVANAQAGKAEADTTVNKLVEEGKAGTEEHAQALRDAADAADSVADAQDGVSSAQINAAAATRSMIAATFEQDVATVGMTAALDKAEQAVIDQRAAFIAAQPEADRLSGKADQVADSMGLIPRDVRTLLEESGAEYVKQKAGEVQGAVNGVPGSKSVDFDVRVSGLNALYTMTTALDSAAAAARRAATSGVAPGSTTVAVAAANGGAIYGPGAKGIDSVPAILAPGEHVLTAAEVDRMGGQAAVYAMRQALMSSGTPRFAEGGAVAVPAAALVSTSAPTINVPASSVHLAVTGDRALIDLINQAVTVRVNGEVRKLVNT